MLEEVKYDEKQSSGIVPATDCLFLTRIYFRNSTTQGYAGFSSLPTGTFGSKLYQNNHLQASFSQRHEAFNVTDGAAAPFVIKTLISEVKLKSEE